MKKTYTKKQIKEAIAYWKNRLKRMDESSSEGDRFNGDRTGSFSKPYPKYKLIPHAARRLREEYPNAEEYVYVKDWYAPHPNDYESDYCTVIPANAAKDRPPSFYEYDRVGDERTVRGFELIGYAGEDLDESKAKKDNGMKKTYTKKQIQEAIKYWRKQLNELTIDDVNREQYDDDIALYSNVEETRIGEHFMKFLKAVKDKGIVHNYVRGGNKKMNSMNQAIGSALAIIALGFTYRADSVGKSKSSDADFYAQCFNDLIEHIKKTDSSAASSLTYIVDHLTEFDEKYYKDRFLTLTDPEVYESI